MRVLCRSCSAISLVGRSVRDISVTIPGKKWLAMFSGPSMTQGQSNAEHQPERRPPVDGEGHRLSRDNPKSRWHEEQVTPDYRSSWACVPLTDAVYAEYARLSEEAP